MSAVRTVRGEIRPVDNFQADAVGEFPKDWVTYPFQGGKAKKVYRIGEEAGKKFLRADDEGGYSVQIFREFDWDLKRFPYLKFRWRAQDLPEGAKETSHKTNDSACGVYVGFGRTSALKYVWSAGLAPGSYWEKNPGKFTIIVLESGEARLGQWREASIHVPEDYQRYFGKPLAKNPSGIGILTDGNRMHRRAACDYGDFRISSQP